MVRHVNIELVYITAILVPQIWKVDIGITFTCMKMNNILLMLVNSVTQVFDCKRTIFKPTHQSWTILLSLFRWLPVNYCCS